MKIRKIHCKIMISKNKECKMYYSKFLDTKKVCEILEKEGWKIISIIPAGKVKV